jgi:ribosomal protein S18 acetylase RimI-like enzyme
MEKASAFRGNFRRMLCLQLIFFSAFQFSIQGLNNVVTYRKARAEDLSGIASLLVETFDDCDTLIKDKRKDKTPSWYFWKKQRDPEESAQNDYVRQLERRMTLPQHMLIVGVDEQQGNIAGFMELGTMPSPISITQKVVVPEGQPIEEGGDEAISIRPERPYLANLAVDSNYRRQRMGTKLVQLAVKIATKWENESAYRDTAAMYLAVERDNEAALSLYDNLKFTRVIDEAELSTSIQGKLNRKPRLYFEMKLMLKDE